MWETPIRQMLADFYGMCARRHMYEYGTTSEQLAWVKVAASHHAQYNPHALLRKVVAVEDVLSSPMVSDPLHRFDCCVISDGGGAVVVTRAEIAKSLRRPPVKVIGAGEGVQGQSAGAVELTASAARQSGSIAFAEARVKPTDIQYASIYDSFTITVLIALEDLGFCEKGQGGRFVTDGNLISGVGRLPFNTDGGGLCSNHPGRGGITKVIEAVRQLRGEAHPAVQVKDCALALAHGTGGWLGARHGSSTLILEREYVGRWLVVTLPNTAPKRGHSGMLLLRAASCCHGVGRAIELIGIHGVYAPIACRPTSTGRSRPEKARFTHSP